MEGSRQPENKNPQRTQGEENRPNPVRDSHLYRQPKIVVARGPAVQHLALIVGKNVDDNSAPSSASRLPEHISNSKRYAETDPANDLDPPSKKQRLEFEGLSVHHSYQEEEQNNEVVEGDGGGGSGNENTTIIFEIALKTLKMALEYESSSIFLVYAHENAWSDASQHVPRQFIKWLNSIGVNLQSDQLPKGSDKGAFFCNPGDDTAIHDILNNQMCLLPRRLYEQSVEKVIVCGSKVLAEYISSAFYKSYQQGIQRVLDDLEGSQKEVMDGLRRVVHDSLNQEGFHHVLTEMALLEGQKHEAGTAARIIPLVLDGEFNEVFPPGFIPATRVRIEFDRKRIRDIDDIQHQHSRFFKMLPHLFEKKDSILKRVENAYFKCVKGSSNDQTMDLAHISHIFYQEVYQKWEDDIKSLRFADFMKNLQDEFTSVSEQRQQNEHERKCLQALFPPGMSYNHQKDQNPNRVPGTCLWALNHPHYIQWRDRYAQKLLWISADAGCGKSVLAKCIVDEDLPNAASGTSIVYFFFKDTSDDQRSACKALLSMIHQLISKNNSFIKHALPLYTQRGDKIAQASFSELWQIFKAVLNDHNAGRVICVLDALDECLEEDREKLIPSIRSFCAEQEARFDVRFLVTSRPYLDLKASFADMITTSVGIQLDGTKESDEIKKEIDFVIESRVTELHQTINLPPEVGAYLKTKLLEMKQRTYLWLHLVLNFIKKDWPTTVSEMRELITTLPKGIDEVYESLLKKCTNEVFARKVLEIVLAAYRPLTVKEIDVALHISRGTTSYRKLSLIGETLKDILPGRCGLMISIVDSKVYFIHQTVKEFLMKKDQQESKSVHHGQAKAVSQNWIWKSSFTIEQGHYQMAMACMRLLLLSEIAAMVINFYQGLLQSWHRPKERSYKMKKVYVFATYSAFYWADHYRDSGVVDNIVDRLIQKNIMIKDGYGFDVAYTIQCTAAGRHEDIFHRLVKKGCDLNEHTSGRYGTLLIAAGYGGHVGIFEWLLAHGADVNAQVEESYYGYGTALQAAAAHGHEAIVERLLAYGADVNAQLVDGYGYGSALQAAAAHGHEAIVERLLAYGADVNAPVVDGYGYGSALQAAAAYGHEAIVERLLAGC